MLNCVPCLLTRVRAHAGAPDPKRGQCCSFIRRIISSDFTEKTHRKMQQGFKSKCFHNNCPHCSVLTISGVRELTPCGHIHVDKGPRSMLKHPSAPRGRGAGAGRCAQLAPIEPLRQTQAGTTLRREPPKGLPPAWQTAHEAATLPSSPRSPSMELSRLHTLSS